MSEKLTEPKLDWTETTNLRDIVREHFNAVERGPALCPDCFCIHLPTQLCQSDAPHP